RAGFDSENDFGVPYIRDISFSGHQSEYRRSAGESFGKSNSNYIQTVIAGNTFDYPMIHGVSIANAGYGFVSCSAGAVENGSVNLNNYKTVDLILGKQKATEVGHGFSGVKFRAFPSKLQSALRGYMKKGGNMLVSGQYIASDLYGNKSTQADRDFAEEVLGIELEEKPERTRSGKIRTTLSGGQGVKERTMSYSNTLNEHQYIVEKPDALRSTNSSDRKLLEFTDTEQSAGFIGKKGNFRRVVMSIPFESITEQSARDALMKDILNSFK
ncbi:MAG: xanthan lyase, partial [Prevotella sp.]|nr:xanthan lyase [Prevotella sp.]